MFAKIMSAGLLGIDGYPVEVETNVTNGLPGKSIVGALSTETRESVMRVSNALKNLDFDPEPRKVTVNLSPAEIKKYGASFDLPIAVSILVATEGLSRKAADKSLKISFFGELGLDGTVKPVKGILPLSFTVKKSGADTIAVPFENAAEATLVEGMTVLGVKSLSDVVSYLEDDITDNIAVYKGNSGSETHDTSDYTIDFSDVHGQEYLKRAAEIAVSGRHNILFSGPAGTGKTMIACRMPTIMPDLTRNEDLEISKLYSVCGLLPEGSPLLSKRPFRRPHHSVSEAAFAGGGMNAVPGEICLASSVVVFLDELPLFPRFVLETMREPMEEGRITISRMKGSFTYPADFQLVAAMNNCACGFYPDKKKCTCSKALIRQYTGRLSRPLMERIDICAEARPISFEEFTKNKTDCTKAETSAEIRKRVEKAFEIQKERFRDEKILYNSRMGIREIEKYCILGKAEESLMKEIYMRKELSGRTYHKVLKVARTIADMDGCQNIEKEHLTEAVELRSIEDRLFSKRNDGGDTI